MKIEKHGNQIQQIIITDIEGELSKSKPGYKEYAEEFKKAYSMAELGHPMYTVFEVNEYCNMNCKMCHRRAELNPNKKNDIDMDLLRKFVNDAREANMPSFFLGARTECLINPNIKEIIKIIREEGLGMEDVLITNGLQMTDEICNLLIDYQWEKVFVSLDAATPETYKKIRGVDLDKVEKNLLNLLELKKKRNSKLPYVRVSFCMQDENMHEIQDFIEKWKDKVDRIDFQTLFDEEKVWDVEEGLPVPEVRCESVFKKLTMNCDGNYYACIVEERLKHSLGNAKDITLKEAWNSDEMVRLRESMRTGELSDLCRTCLKNMNNNLVELSDEN